MKENPKFSALGFSFHSFYSLDGFFHKEGDVGISDWILFYPEIYVISTNS
jgi:hypothetical protein